MTIKDISTLIPDIYGILNPEVHHEPKEENLKAFYEAVTDSLKKFLNKDEKANEPFRLRASNIGKPKRQLWYDSRVIGNSQSRFSPEKLLSFLYGSIIEHILILLAKESGHSVTKEKKKVEIDGIQGELDCFIDGVLTDEKSTSFKSFDKFSKGTLLSGDDPFGYVPQLSFYAEAEGEDTAAFVAMDKSTGSLALLQLNSLDLVPVKPLIQDLRDMLTKETPPERCYAPVPEGTSGNLGLSRGCEYCPHKINCWKDINNGQGLQVFQYSNGFKFLTKIMREPTVPNVTKEYKQGKIESA